MNITIAPAHEYSKEKRSPLFHLISLFVPFFSPNILSPSVCPLFELLYLGLKLNWNQTNVGLAFLSRTVNAAGVTLACKMQ